MSGNEVLKIATAKLPAAEYGGPQQHRAFVGAPYCGNPVDERKGGVGVLRDVGEAEVGDDEHVGEAQVRDADEQELCFRGGNGDRGPRGYPAPRAEQGNHALHGGDREGKNQGQVAELADHSPIFPCGAIFPPRFAISIASATSGGM